MSQNMLRISAKELKTVRVKCKGKMPPQQEKQCGMIFEVCLDQLADAFPGGRCPRCNQSFENPVSGPKNILEALAHSLDTINRFMNGRLEIEFDLPEPSTQS